LVRAIGGLGPGATMADLLSGVVAIARGLAVARDHRRDAGRRGDSALVCLALAVAYRESASGSARARSASSAWRTTAGSGAMRPSGSS
jgi:hypothetical protein